MQRADTPELARAEGIKIAREMLSAARPMIEGVQVSAPFGRYSCAIEILQTMLPQASAAGLAGESRREAKPEGTTVGNL